MIVRFAVAAFLVLITSGCDLQTKPAGHDTQLSSQMDEIKKMFGAGNWRLSNDGDTSYFFFSPKTPLRYDVYHYTIRNGDSVNSKQLMIHPQSDSLIWVMKNKEMRLVDAGNNRLVWSFQQDGKKMLCEFVKADSSHILYKQNGETTGVFNLTVAISSFLVRTKYNYEHGSRLTDSMR